MTTGAIIDIEKLNGGYVDSANKDFWNPPTFPRAKAIAAASRTLRGEGGGTIRIFDQTSRKDTDEPDEEIKVYG